MEKFCTECGASTESGDKYCGGCGRLLNQTELDKDSDLVSSDRSNVSHSQNPTPIVSKTPYQSRLLRSINSLNRNQRNAIAVSVIIVFVVILTPWSVLFESDQAKSSLQQLLQELSEEPRQRQNAPREAATGAPQNVLEITTPVFTPSESTIVGEWYPVASNPRILGQIVTDWGHYIFRADGTVLRIYPPEKLQGTFRFNSEKRHIEATFDRGESGIQEWFFRQTSEGEAKAFFWKNLTLGNDHPVSDRFVRKGSPEWSRRTKTKVN